MSDTIYKPTKQFIEETYWNIWDIVTEEEVMEGTTFHTWGAALGWDICTKAITGVPQTEEHKRKKAESKSREIEIEGVLYKSGKEASEKLGYCPGAISAWAKKNGSRYGISIPKGSNQCTYGKNRS